MVKGIEEAIVTVTAHASAELEVKVPLKVLAYVAVTSVSLGEDFALGYGETKQLEAVIEPGNASNKKVTWTTSDQTVVSVSAEGLVEAHKEGQSTIRVESADGKYDECVVTVNAPKALESIALNKTTLKLKQGDTEQLEVTYTPSIGVVRDVSWSSSAPSVARVVDGLVTAVGPGSATITVTSQHDNTKRAACEVTVTAYVQLESIAFKESEVEMRVGMSLTPGVVHSVERNESVGEPGVGQRGGGRGVGRWGAEG